MSEHQNHKKARRLLTRHGYRVGGHVHSDEDEDKELYNRGISRLAKKVGEAKLAAGGYKRAGRADKRHRGRGGNKIIIVAPHAGGAPGVPGAAPMAKPPMPPVAPGAPPVAARPPMPPAAPRPPMPMAKRGRRVGR